MANGIDEIIQNMNAYLDKPDEKLVRDAYEFAHKMHLGQKRASGEDFISHPLSVAQVLTEMKMDSVTIAAGLLHDVVEDTEATSEDIKKRFGDHVAVLVDGVTKLDKFSFENREAAQLENFRKMFLIMAEHVRVVFIKLADRLVNIRTLQHLPRADQKRIAKETLDIYAPLAERLGMGQVKGELNDLAFRYLEPKRYEKISKEMSKAVSQRKKNVGEMISALEKKFKENKLTGYKVEGRDKHVYSTYKKLPRVANDIGKVYDLIAVRIMVRSIEDCYKALGAIHSMFKPLINTFKDYISVPKPNGYRSLHTTVFGINGQVTEIQIRTYEMHEEAEKGLAAHWYYSEVKRENSKRYLENRNLIKSPKERLAWVKTLSDWQKNITYPEFEELLKIDLFKDRILVMSPMGDLYDLPNDATPVDFAFSIHSDLGYRIIGAKVNDRIVSLNYQLSNRDVVEILTTKQNKGPSLDWLNFVKTSHAKHRIKSWFKKLNSVKNADAGNRALENAIQKIAPDAKAALIRNLGKISRSFNLKSEVNLYEEIGAGNITTDQVLRSILKPEARAVKTRVRLKSDAGVVVLGSEGIKVKLATCCSPKTGDLITGYITRGKGITAHKPTCKNVAKLEKERFVSVAWDLGRAVLVPIRLIGKNRVGLLRDISSQISNMGVNITSVSSKSIDSDTSAIDMALELEDSSALLDVMDRLKVISDVSRVERI